MQTGVPDLWSLQGPVWYEHLYSSEEGSVSPAEAWAGQGYEGGVARSQDGVWSGHQAQSHVRAQCSEPLAASWHTSRSGPCRSEL